MFYILTELVSRHFSFSICRHVCGIDEILFLSFEPENRDVLQHNGWIDH